MSKPPHSTAPTCKRLEKLRKQFMEVWLLWSVQEGALRNVLEPIIDSDWPGVVDCAHLKCQLALDYLNVYVLFPNLTESERALLTRVAFFRTIIQNLFSRIAGTGFYSEECLALTRARPISAEDKQVYDDVITRLEPLFIRDKNIAKTLLSSGVLSESQCEIIRGYVSDPDLQ